MADCFSVLENVSSFTGMVSVNSKVSKVMLDLTVDPKNQWEVRFSSVVIIGLIMTLAYNDN